MNFNQILEMARRRIVDNAGTYETDRLLPKDVAAIYLNEAIEEACRRARLIIDSTTQEICKIDVLPDVSVYPYDDRIIKIQRVMIASRDTPLKQASYRDLDNSIAGWQKHKNTPSQYCLDMNSGKILLYPTPVIEDSLTLTVSRLPLSRIDYDGTPEIPSRYHAKLVSWIIHKIRDSDDSELYHPTKSAIALREFEQEFGVARSANSEMFENTQPDYEGEW